MGGCPSILSAPAPTPKHDVWPCWCLRHSRERVKCCYCGQPFALRKLKIPANAGERCKYTSPHLADCKQYDEAETDYQCVECKDTREVIRNRMNIIFPSK